MSMDLFFYVILYYHFISCNYQLINVSGTLSILKTIACIFIVALGILFLSIPNLAVQIIGGLTVGSMLCCYILSIYETQSYDNRSRHELR
jgi:hypothetical protein